MFKSGAFRSYQQKFKTRMTFLGYLGGRRHPSKVSTPKVYSFKGPCLIYRSKDPSAFMSLKKWWRSQKYISYFAAVNYWTRVKMWARIFAILICTSPLLNPQSLEFRSMNLEFCIHFKMQKNVCRKINNFNFRKALICSSFNHMLECLHYKWSPWFQKL